MYINWKDFINKILTRNVSKNTQDHKKNLKIMIIEVVEESVTVENKYWMIPINIINNNIVIYKKTWIYFTY